MSFLKHPKMQQGLTAQYILPIPKQFTINRILQSPTTNVRARVKNRALNRPPLSWLFSTPTKYELVVQLYFVLRLRLTRLGT